MRVDCYNKNFHLQVQTFSILVQIVASLFHSTLVHLKRNLKFHLNVCLNNQTTLAHFCGEFIKASSPNSWYEYIKLIWCHFAICRFAMRASSPCEPVRHEHAHTYILLTQPNEHPHSNLFLWGIQDPTLQGCTRVAVIWQTGAYGELAHMANWRIWTMTNWLRQTGIWQNVIFPIKPMKVLCVLKLLSHNLHNLTIHLRFPSTINHWAHASNVTIKACRPKHVICSYSPWFLSDRFVLDN